MKPDAVDVATKAASDLSVATGAKYTVVIAADVSDGNGHLIVGSFCPDAGLAEGLIAATLKKIREQKAARNPATIGLGRGKGKRGVW